MAARNIHELEDKMDQRFTEVTEYMNNSFVAIDKRFVAIDKRFVAIDKRFVAIDKRFVAIDRRLDTLDKRLNTLGEHVHKLGVLHEETNHKLDILLEIQINNIDLKHRVEKVSGTVNQHTVKIRALEILHKRKRLNNEKT